MDIREFKADEIAEINTYVTTQIPQSILPEMFLLSEEPYKKVVMFLATFRILTGVKDYLENGSTKKKMIEFLNEFKQEYNKLHKMFLISENSSYAPKLQKRKIIYLLRNEEINLKLNRLTNSFLVFAEKQELLETDKVTGISLDSLEGSNLYKDVTKNINRA